MDDKLRPEASRGPSLGPDVVLPSSQLILGPHPETWFTSELCSSGEVTGVAY